MAAIAKQCFAFFLLALCFSVQIQARESQFFNKVPSNNGDREAEIVAAADALADGPSAEPSFVPENENGGYGLYGHNAGQLPPTTTSTPAKATKTTTPKYLPKNYNVKAYVTVPEGYRGAQENDDNNRAATNAAAEFDNNKNPNFYNSEKEQNFGEANLYSNGNYYNNKNRGSDADSDSDDADSDSDEFTPDNTNFYDSQKENTFYNENNNDENQNPNVRKYEPFNSKKNFNLYGDNSYGEPKKTGPYFNSKKGFNLYGNSGNQQSNYNGGLEDAKFADSSKYNNFESNNNGGRYNGVQKQGMSDTRFLENGKYFYDVNLEQQKYSRNYNRPAYSNNYNKYYQGQEQDLP